MILNPIPKCYENPPDRIAPSGLEIDRFGLAFPVQRVHAPEGRGSRPDAFLRRNRQPVLLRMAATVITETKQYGYPGGRIAAVRRIGRIASPRGLGVIVGKRNEAFDLAASFVKWRLHARIIAYKPRIQNGRQST